jgi:4-amino-4-deoxy-L-arabinose transferase-like glycosyltransferase
MIFAGLALLPYPGIQADEALPGAAIYVPQDTAHSFRVGRELRLSTMVLTYYGALKSWLYLPIFRLFPPSALSVRLPVLLIGVTTVVVFMRLLLHLGGPVAAGLGAVLLATDPVFILTATFDWGPVAIQNLLLVSTLLFAVLFHQKGDGRALYASAFCCGLALWNKATFLWLLVGLVSGLVLLWGTRVRSLLSRRQVTVAAACLLVGALPLVTYNIGSGFRTFRDREYSLRDLDLKVSALRKSLEGDILFGYMTRPEWQTAASGASNALERTSLRISDSMGQRRKGLGLWILLLAAALGFGAAGKRRVLAFLLIVVAVAWLQMLVTADAGTSAHHTALLWPLCFGFISIALANLFVKRKAVAFAVCGLVLAAVAQNALVLNQYLADWVRFGPSAVWTDAVFPLTQWARTARPEKLILADWGVAEPLKLLLEGRVPTEHAIRPYERKSWDERERERASRLLQDREAVFVDRTAGNHVFPDLSRLLNELALEEGYSREVLTIVRDRHGRPMFELYRFVRH